MHRAYLLLGSNLGDRAAMLQAAIDAIGQTVTLTAKSSTYRTEPWQMDSDDWFYNQVIEVETSLNPISLLEFLLSVERALGRDRSKGTGTQYASREIDIDILYYDDLLLETPALAIPHPRVQDRRFALAPMVELAPGLVHPRLKQSQRDLLNICPDQSLLEQV